MRHNDCPHKMLKEPNNPLSIKKSQKTVQCKRENFSPELQLTIPQLGEDARKWKLIFTVVEFCIGTIQESAFPVETLEERWCTHPCTGMFIESLY